MPVRSNTHHRAQERPRSARRDPTSASANHRAPRAVRAGRLIAGPPGHDWLRRQLSGAGEVCPGHGALRSTTAPGPPRTPIAWPVRRPAHAARPPRCPARLERLARAASRCAVPRLALEARRGDHHPRGRHRPGSRASRPPLHAQAIDPLRPGSTPTTIDQRIVPQPAKHRVGIRPPLPDRAGRRSRPQAGR